MPSSPVLWFLLIFWSLSIYLHHWILKYPPHAQKAVSLCKDGWHDVYTFHTFGVVCIDENLSVLISFVCHVWQFPFSVFYVDQIPPLLTSITLFLHNVKRFIGEKCIKSIFINKLYYTDTQRIHRQKII